MILWSFASTIPSVNELKKKINMICFPHSMSLISVCQLTSYFSQRREAIQIKFFFCRALALNKSSTLIQLTGFFTLQKKFLSNKSDHHFQSCNMNACPPLVQILLSELSPIADQGKCRHTVLYYRTHCYDWTSTATTFSPLLILSSYCLYLIDNTQYFLVREDLL